MHWILALIVALVSPQTPSLPDGPTVIAQLSKARLDKTHVYAIRDINIRRDALSFSFNRGLIAFLEPIGGKVTGAVFVGDGEIVAFPPNDIERQQIHRYTDSAVLNERFDAAYLRFTDGAHDEIVKAVKERAEEEVSPEDREALLQRDEEFRKATEPLHARILDDVLGSGRRPFFAAQLRSSRLGWFRATYDERLAEEVLIAGGRSWDSANAGPVWAHFDRRADTGAAEKQDVEGALATDVLSYEVDAAVRAGMSLEAKTSIRFRAVEGGGRVLRFALSPRVRVTSAAAGDSRPLAFHQGSAGVAVVLDQPMESGHEAVIQIAYVGSALAPVHRTFGVSREFWHPAAVARDWARFSLTFHFPVGWNLVATGDKLKEWEEAGQRHSVWTSDGAYSAAFNVGACTAFSDDAAMPSLHTCPPADPNVLNPKGYAARVLSEARAAVATFREVLGEAPHSRLTISPIPSLPAKSGPGLVYAPAALFLSEGDFAEAERSFAREMARQWLDQSMAAASDRDRWMLEGLAGYLAAMHFERRHSESQSQALMERARAELLERSPEGSPYAGLGPVSIGARLAGPGATLAYIRALENKSVWIMHMLRAEMRGDGDDDAAFLRTIREFAAGHRGRFATTGDFKRIAEKHAGRSLDRFFDQWVSGTAIPAYSLDYKVSPAGDAFVIEGVLRQTGVPDTFTMPVPLYAGDALLGRVAVTGGQAPFRFTSKENPKELRIDPKSTILTTAR